MYRTILAVSALARSASGAFAADTNFRCTARLRNGRHL